MINFNSNTNQRIKGEFVKREIYSNVGTMAEYILGQEDYKNAPFTWEDVENYYQHTCPNCGDTNTVQEIENDEGGTIYSRRVRNRTSRNL